MKKFISSIAFCAALGAFSAVASADPTCDFSDITTPFLTLPFNVTNVEVTGEWTTMRHNYYLAESYDKVVKAINKLYDQGKPLDKYVIMGITPQMDGSTQIILALNNEHFYVGISANGAGSLMSLEARPASYVTGVYDVSVYGFVLPDGTEVSTDLMTEE